MNLNTMILIQKYDKYLFQLCYFEGNLNSLKLQYAIVQRNGTSGIVLIFC